MDATIEFFIFAFVFVSNSTLNKLWIFGPNLPEKDIYGQKQKKVNIVIVFCILKLVVVRNFSLNWQFWFFGPHLRKKGFSGLKQKKGIPPLNSAYSNWSRYQISPQTDNFDDLLDQIFPKKVFLVKKKKSEHTMESCIFELVQVPNFSLNW